MNCIEHEDRNAVSTCKNCGVGLCKDCEGGSIFRSDTNQAYCKKCNYEIACKNDNILNSGLKIKKIVLYIYSVAVAIGLILLLVLQMNQQYRKYAVLIMLLCWAFGSIANFFDDVSSIRRFLKYIGNSIKEAGQSNTVYQFVGSILGLVLGIILGIFMMGIFSPILLIANLIGIFKVKKQIANNNAILSQFQVEDSQNEGNIES